MLLHKAALENSHQLTSEAASAIADEDQQVVAVVINAIDDALAKSDQIRIAWTLETIPLLAEVLDVRLPDAGFYLWAGVRGSDTEFARELLAQYNVTVLPGSYLARETPGGNPGAGRIRMALVAETAECLEAAQRIVQFVQSSRTKP